MPEIDGLRFIAIASVFICHFNIFFILKNEGNYTTIPSDYGLLNFIAANGSYGVHLFFVISGFILFLPFAKHYLKNDKKPLLKDYYLRRLFRIEPPYFIVMILLFIAGVFIFHQYTFSQGIPNLLASLTYTHNLFYGRDTLPLINAVAWSLEVEVQFYLLAPFIAKIFAYKPRLRRSIILVLILIFVCLQNTFKAPFLSIYDFLQYFFIGFLLADLFVSGDKIFKKTNLLLEIIAGMVFFCLLWSHHNSLNSNLFSKIGWEFLHPFFIFSFYYLVLFTPFWKNLLSKKVLTTIGGMCYSIYLLHNPIIWSFDNLPINRKFSNYYLVDWFIHFIILALLVFLISVIFFIIIEKPCMRRNWYNNLSTKMKEGLKLSF